MHIELRRISTIRPYENNPRLNDAAVAAVAASIQQFGFRQPIVVDEDGVIIVGHTRYKAALKLGLEEVPVHDAIGLTPAQAKVYRLADNQTATLSQWGVAGPKGEGVMNANAVAKHYSNLTPAERFRLILAARVRGDETEQDRLMSAGQRITLSMPDHAPYGHAFDELALLVFIELLEEAAHYFEAFAHADEIHDFFGEDEEEDGGDAEAGESAEAEASRVQVDAVSAEPDASERSLCQRYRDLALAAGFTLRTKAEGWKLFCERLTIPPFALWEGLPGYDRLQRALKLTEQSAFVAEGFVHWLNSRRPAGEPERMAPPLTVEGMAADAEQVFRERVEWWGG
jgi:hypothetical protein